MKAVTSDEHPRIEVMDDEDDKGKEDREETEDNDVNNNNVPEKTFLERVADLINALRSVDGFKDHSGLVAFEVVIQTTAKKTGEQRVNLEEGIRDVFEKFYSNNQKYLLKEDMEFLTKDGESIKFGRSGKANIPLFEIYTDLQESNPEMIDTIDASIYFVMQHVCPEDDLDKIISICKEFEPDKVEGGGGGNFLSFIGNIVGRVSEKLGGENAKNLETDDGQINTGAVGSVVQDLIQDSVIRDSMSSMMSSISNEDFDINTVVKGLFNMAGNQPKKE